jgi:hypothetical protein
MSRKFNQVYQFKITLTGLEPLIWRQIQVPETYSFWDLHVAIQDVMSWLDCHLHLFTMRNPLTGKKVKIGIPEDEFAEDVLAGWKQKIADYFSMENKTTDYLYDFGDNWAHTVVLEKIIPRETGIKYPVCITGEKACPPEDCGGTDGYFNFLETITNPFHEQHKEMLHWAGEKFDPAYFNPTKVKFWNPQKRFKIAFEEK